jgi:predicted RNA-binding Zn-ribbon protein involved in translation (DUF1610 family)
MDEPFSFSGDIDDFTEPVGTCPACFAQLKLRPPTSFEHAVSLVCPGCGLAVVVNQS